LSHPVSQPVTSLSDLQVARDVLNTEAGGLLSLAASLGDSFSHAIDRMTEAVT